jgi:hypothetical protein
MHASVVGKERVPLRGKGTVVKVDNNSFEVLFDKDRQTGTDDAAPLTET